MQHIHNEFEANAGDVIEVTIDHPANVQFLDQANYDLYKSNQGYRYTGGHATTSPVRFEVPRDGRWHITVDLGGGPGRVKAWSRLYQGTSA
jgi:hypothetical protein